ncbi:uncharacterized protein TrAFT101_008304 [Trichoderma asperellum]|nr:hypothetical protein TrAFT101_008304 [Trichoderma asperellum]
MFLAQFDRFELWAVNLGLFVMGHGSLDYRIRDSESMKESMYMMIQNLNRSLDEVLDYVNGNIGQEDDDSDIDSESESDIDLLLGSIKDPIDRLYKLAVWIRNPATRLTSSKARNFKQIDPESNVDLFESYENHDYDYVSSLFLEYEKHKALQEAPAVECKDKNPVGGDRDADDKDHVWEPIRGVLKLHKERILHCSESYLVRRIARANGRRRQQFAYWKRHQDKLREHASMFVEAPARQLSDAEHIINGLIGETKTVLSVTTATQLRIPQLAGQEILEKEGVLKLDVSEYAPSAWNPSKDTVSFPLPPKVSTSDNFFECPYCYTICPISLLSEKAWRAHIIRDLRPYICTYEQCSNAEQLYDTRDEWMQHEISTHQRIFRCSKHEEEIFTTLEAYKEHVQNYHKGEAEFSKFATSTVKNVHRSCPVCSIILGSIEKLQSHIALHLERFAMFSLPRHIDNDDQSEAGSHSNHAKLDSISFNEDPDVESTWTDGIGDAQSGNLTNLEQDIILPVSAEDNSSDEGKGTQQCEVPGCGKTFKSFKQLKLHILLYHDELPRGDFICGFCTAERTFAHIDDLKRHMIDVHRLKQTPPTRRKGTNVALLTLADYPPGATGKCGTCPKTFPNAQVFYDHLDGCLMSFKDEDGGGRMKYAEERGEEKARHLAHKQKRREEEESRRLEYEAERRRLSARFEKPLRQVAARGSRRRSAVYEDGVVYRLDDALERTQDGTHLREEPPTPHIAADYNNDKESGNRDGPSTRATAQGVAFSSPKSPQQHDSSQMQENIGLSSELNAKNAYKPMPMYDLDITDSSPADPENMERRGSPNMDDALNYLDKVKDHFQDKPEVYEQFIEIFQNMKEQQAPLQDLLEDFKQFLPDSKDQTPRGQTQNKHRAKGSINADQFMKNLMGFMREMGLPLDPKPMIRDKPISLVILFHAVQAKGGFKTLTARNGWSSMAQTLGLQTQNPNVVVALRQIYEQNLLRFEEAWVALQEVDLKTILGTPQKQVPPGQARASLGRPEDGTAAGSDYTPQQQVSGHMGSSTEPTQDGTHLQEEAHTVGSRSLDYH